MRFTHSFTLAASGGTGTPAVAAPTAAPNRATMPSLFSTRFADAGGWPGQRVAIAYASLSGTTPVNLTCQAYVWEEQTQAWHKLGAAITLAPNTITFVDTISVLSQAPIAGRSETAGAFEVFLQVNAAATNPNGSYMIAMAADVSNRGT